MGEREPSFDGEPWPDGRRDEAYADNGERTNVHIRTSRRERGPRSVDLPVRTPRFPRFLPDPTLRETTPTAEVEDDVRRLLDTLNVIPDPLKERPTSQSRD